MRFQLEGPDLAEIHARAVAGYGPHARIVSAERVTVGGIGGFLAKTHLEAIIEVPDEHAPDGLVLDPGDVPQPHGALAPVGKPRSPQPDFSRPEPVKPESLRPEPPEPGSSRQGSPRQGSTKALPTNPTGAEPVAGKPGSPAPRSFTAAALTPDSPAVAGGLDGLLARADEAELRLAPQVPVFAEGSTLPPLPGRPDFDRLLDRQAFDLEPATGSRVSGPRPAGATVPGKPAVRDAAADRVIVPSPLAGPGDLVVVVGLWGDAGMAAAELDGGTALRRNAGELAQKFDAGSMARRPLTDRRGILKARANAVAEGVPLVACVAINPQQELLPQMELLEVLDADQLWAAVDAGRKAEDTAAWIKQVAAGHGLYAVISLHGEETLSPETVWELGFPVLEARGPGA